MPPFPFPAAQNAGQDADGASSLPFALVVEQACVQSDQNDQNDCVVFDWDQSNDETSFYQW